MVEVVSKIFKELIKVGGEGLGVNMTRCKDAIHGQDGWEGGGVCSTGK